MREPGGNASGRVRGVAPGRGNVFPGADDWDVWDVRDVGMSPTSCASHTTRVVYIHNEFLGSLGVFKVFNIVYPIIVIVMNLFYLLLYYI